MCQHLRVMRATWPCIRRYANVMHHVYAYAFEHVRMAGLRAATAGARQAHGQPQACCSRQGSRSGVASIGPPSPRPVRRHLAAPLAGPAPRHMATIGIARAALLPSSDLEISSRQRRSIIISSVQPDGPADFPRWYLATEATAPRSYSSVVCSAGTCICPDLAPAAPLAQRKEIPGAEPAARSR